MESPKLLFSGNDEQPWPGWLKFFIDTVLMEEQIYENIFIIESRELSSDQSLF